MRRTLIRLAVLASLVIATAPAAAAQNGSDEHPLVGAWIVDPTPQDPDDPPDLFVFAPGGIAVTGITQGTGVGAWQSTGERTADLTMVAPALHPEVGFQGFFTGRGSIDVAEDGQSFTGTSTIELPVEIQDILGLPAGQLGPREFTGRRISAEAPGEPVAPLPDLSDPMSIEESSE